MHISARCYYSRSGFSRGSNSGNAFAFGGGGQGDDGDSALRAGGAANEIHLASDAAVGQVADRIGADLAGQIHLQRRVDGHHAVVLRDDEWIVGVSRGVELEDGVVVDELEKPAGSEDEGRDHLVRVDGLALVVHHAKLDQVDQLIGDHLAVNAQVLVVAQRQQHRFGNPSDAGLKHGDVGDDPGNVGRYGVMDGRDPALLVLGQGVRGLDDGLRLADVNERVAESAGRLIVDFDDEVAGAVWAGEGDVNAGAQAHVAVVVGRGALDQRDVDGDDAGLEQALDFVEEDGDVIGAALLDGAAEVGADEHGAGTENALILREGIVGRAHGRHMEDFDVTELGRAAQQSGDQRLRFGAALVNQDAVA